MHARGILKNPRYVQIREREADLDGFMAPIEEMYALLRRYQVWPSRYSDI